MPDDHTKIMNREYYLHRTQSSTSELIVICFDIIFVKTSITHNNPFDRILLRFGQAVDPTVVLERTVFKGSFTVGKRKENGTFITTKRIAAATRECTYYIVVGSRNT